MTDTNSALGLPYSTIRKVGNCYYIAGHTGVDMASKTIAKDVKSQTKQLFANLKSTLDVYNLQLDDIFKTTVFLTNMDDFAAFNEEYMGYFKDPRPARSTVSVRELPRIADNPLVVEIEAIAYKG